jgi:succinate dehydrogenase/fumarate reductase cytochrome b subunit
MMSSKSSMSSNSVIWISASAAAIYPWILDAFHWSIASPESNNSATQLTPGVVVLAAFLLVAAFAVPLINMMMASRTLESATPPAQIVRARRFALLSVIVPTAYVFFGVITYMAGSKIPYPWIWTPTWLVLGYLASRRTKTETTHRPRISPGLRVAHGIAGAIAAAYIFFHIFNHLFGLVSPEAHAAVMDIGRKVYRTKFIEPILVAVLLFQVISGLRLAWTWSETTVDHSRLFQIASGVFMAVFILGHMNSVFIFARMWLNIPTDWAFATGLPTGLIYDS